MNQIMFNLLLVLVSNRWTGKTHKVKVKRETSPENPEINEVIQNLNSLNYNGQIDQAAQPGDWFPTKTGEMMQYNTPRRNESVKLEEAVKLCTDMDSKLWDEKPQLALSFSNIEPNANYWISDSNGAMAQYTKKDPEVVYDDICTQVKLTTTSDGEEPEIEVTTVLDKTDPSLGCSTDEFKGLTLCLRPVKSYKYANNKEYRSLQREAKTIVNQETAVKRLQDIQTELTANNYKTNIEKTKIPPKLQTITNNINTIRTEDTKPFPDFKQIKTKWTDIVEKMQDLETISTKIASDHKLKEVKEQVENKIEVNIGQRVANNLAWTDKWNIINQKFENIQIKVNNLETNTNNVPTEDRRETEHREEEDQEDADPTPEPAEGYFQKFIQAYEKRQQSLQRFCLNWKLDCRVVVMGGMFMTGIGAGCTVLIIFITIQTCNTAKKVKRIRHYLDIKDTRKEQAEDDQHWKEKIEQEEGKKDIPIPNPTRNHAMMRVIRKKLTILENKTEVNTNIAEHNFEEISSNWNTTRQAATRDQEENETIPLLEKTSMP